jgi:flagellum-specific peptidoglycan hydrolase FlgJ
MTREEKYISENYDAAIQVKINTGMPYQAILALAAVRTKWGKELYENNFFFAKTAKGEYKKFENAYESFSDYAREIKRKYPVAFQYRKDPDEFIRSVQRDHETRLSDDRNYAKKIISIMALVKQIVKDMGLDNNKTKEVIK